MTPDNAPPSFFKTHGLRVLLALISLLMIADLVLRGLNLAFEPAKTDVSDAHAGAWLWRHGQNFYDSALATRAHEQLVHASFQIAPVYPPTAFVLVSPFTFLPWGWANFIWLLLGLAGIAATIFFCSGFAALQDGIGGLWIARLASKNRSSRRSYGRTPQV